MAFSISIKPLVSEAAYFYLQDFGLSKTTIRKIATITIVAANCVLVANWFIPIFVGFYPSIDIFKLTLILVLRELR
jgi:hypothetical protein